MSLRPHGVAVSKKRMQGMRHGWEHKEAVLWLSCQTLSRWKSGCRNMGTTYCPELLLGDLLTCVFWAGPALSHNDTTNQRRQGSGRWGRTQNLEEAVLGPAWQWHWPWVNNLTSSGVRLLVFKKMRQTCICLVRLSGRIQINKTILCKQPFVNDDGVLRN